MCIFRSKFEMNNFHVVSYSKTIVPYTSSVAKTLLNRYKLQIAADQFYIPRQTLLRLRWVMQMKRRAVVMFSLNTSSAYHMYS
jgi:hypothetical protein